MESELIFEGDLGSVFTSEPDQTISVTEGEAGVGVEVETEVGVDTMQLGLEEIQQETQQIIEEEVETLTSTIQLLPEVPIQVEQPPEPSLEDQLKSQERLDRSSPDLWPQNLPTAAQYLLAKNQPKTATADSNLGIWAQGLDPEDINLLHQFGSLTSASLVEEVKKLQNIAYQLGLEEAKEMTRGKLLHVLDDNYHGSHDKERHVQRLWK